jgi:hypothetical protein
MVSPCDAIADASNTAAARESMVTVRNTDVTLFIVLLL